MKHNFNHSEISDAIITATDKHPDLINVHYSAVQDILSLLPEPAKQFTVSEVTEAWDEAQHEFGMLTHWENLTGNMQNQLAEFAVNLGYTITGEHQPEADQHVSPWLKPETGQTFDPVQKAKHYNLHPSGVECIDIIRHHIFNIGNAIKYLWRNGLKEEADMPTLDKQIQDLEKAVYYIEDEISRLRAEQ